MRKDSNRRTQHGLEVALIHAAIHWKDKEKNLSSLLSLNEEAARFGAQVILNTELATTGYAFESREEIAPLAETIPGPTTEAFGQISKEHGCYICIGLAEVDRKTGIFYNSAALVGPGGDVLGVYRKFSPAFKENLWASRGNLPAPIVETDFGKLCMAICADAYSYKPARIAALKGARLLLIPANWPPEHHNPEMFWRARAAENGFYILACNRTGKDKVMDCRNAESFIIGTGGEIISKASSPKDLIVYCTLPLTGGTGRLSSAAADEILIRRRPECYGNISLDTFSNINVELLLSLPRSDGFNVAVIQFRPSSRDIGANLKGMLRLVDEAVAKAASKRLKIDLMIFPELSTTGIISSPQEAEDLCEEIPGITTGILAQKARERDIFIVTGMAECESGKLFNSCVLIGPDGLVGKYRKAHLTRLDEAWARPGEGDFRAFNLPFARIGLMIGNDLCFPESADCLAKLGSDILCVPALWLDQKSKFLWDARLGEQMHLAIANQWGVVGGSYALGKSLICSYSRYPDKRSVIESPAQGDDIEIMELFTKDAREKRFLENVDYGTLLDLENHAPAEVQHRQRSPSQPVS